MRNKFFYLIIFFYAAIIVAAGCSRKALPVGEAVTAEDSFDKAKFNYVYVEAIKQKLMGNGGEALKRLEEAIED